MTDFYQGLLGRQVAHKFPLDLLIVAGRSTLSLNKQISLCAPFMEKDIKEALFSIPNIKSPGPHGDSSDFF